MAKNLLLLFLGGFAIYGAVMVDLNVLREHQKSALLSKVEAPKSTRVTAKAQPKQAAPTRKVVKKPTNPHHK